MIRLLKVSRDGQELGAWPFDLVFALIRCGSLVPTDAFWIEGMDEPRSLAEIIPPSPSHSKPATFLGRDDEDSGWGFYCRDASTAIGPRTVEEIMALIIVGGLSADHRVFFVPGERWMSVADMLRTAEQESPGILEVVRRVQAVSAEQSAVTDSEQLAENPVEWLNTAGNIAMLSPHIAMGYLGLKGLKKFLGVDPLKGLMSLLNEPPPERSQRAPEIHIKPSESSAAQPRGN